jgi:uncharacterized protein (TIGR02271 family)
MGVEASCVERALVVGVEAKLPGVLRWVVGQAVASVRSEGDDLLVDLASELVRLKKRVVTEAQQVTVPVQHEEVRLEREPITGANREQALDGPAIHESEHDMTLNEEEVVVSERTVPKERVQLDKDVVTDQQTVQEDVRKERIDVEREQRHA